MELEDIHIEDEAETSKILGQLQFEVRKLLKPLRMYGQETYCVQVEQAFMELFWVAHWKMLGVDVPYEIKRPTY